MKTTKNAKRASCRAEPHCWRFSPRPCAGEHFAVTKMTEDDIKNGDKLSCVIGDTYISYERMSPLVQWQHIALALRAHGLCVANAAGQGTAEPYPAPAGSQSGSEDV